MEAEREERDTVLRNAIANARFEIIPAKGVVAELRHLPAGATVTITCSPRRGIERGLELAEEVVARGFRAVPHIAARLVLDKRHLAEVLERLAQLGVEDVFVIGGDEERPAGIFADALSLLRAMVEVGPLPKRIGVAAYPEGHPKVAPEGLLAVLREKSAIAHYMVTQICFDAQRLIAWTESMRQAGVGLTLYVGVPGAVERAKLLEIALRIGVGDSARFLRKHAHLMGTLARQETYRADDLLMALLPLFRTPDGAAGLHINTFNQLAGTVTWWQALMERVSETVKG